LSARISVSSVVFRHTDAGTVPSCCFQRFSDLETTAGQSVPRDERLYRVRGKVVFSVEEPR